MAQYAHDGGEQAGAFEAQTEWPMGNWPSFAPFYDSGGNPPAILDQSDTSYLTNFFRNPEATAMNGLYDGWASNGPHIKAESGGFDPPPNFFVQAPQQQTQAHDHNNHNVAPHMHAHINNDYEGSFEDLNAMDAASGLYQLGQTVGHQRSPFNAQSSLEHLNGMAAAVASGGSWGMVADHGQSMMGEHGEQGGNQNLQSPLTSSGRQSSHSYHSLPQYVTNPLNPSYGRLIPQQQDWVMHPDHITAGGHDTSSQARAHGSQRPVGMQFGSDDGFAGTYYQPPRGSVSREDEKSSNLINVPYSDRVAASSHAHPISSGHYRLSGQSSNKHPGMQSQAFMGGLPANYIAQPTMRRSMTAAEIPRNSIEGVDGANEIEDRRVSVPQADNDLAYGGPTNHVKAKTKRGLKATKSFGDLSFPPDDEEYVDSSKAFTSSNNKSSKRRKLGGNSPQSSPGSQEYSSPRDDDSDTPEQKPKGGSKKKAKSTKQARMNLTQAEKRLNHIRSEKNRRDLIKLQYDQLDQLVPALRQGKSGLSRADIILEIVNYVVFLQVGNEQMRKIVEELPDAEDEEAEEEDVEGDEGDGDEDEDGDLVAVGDDFGPPGAGMSGDWG